MIVPARHVYDQLSRAEWLIAIRQSIADTRRWTDNITERGKALMLPRKLSEKEKQSIAALRQLHDERYRKGQCRHCGGAIPCASPFGDIEVGVSRLFSARRIRKGTS